MVSGDRDTTRRDDEQVFGVAWYSEIEWAKLVAIAADPEVLEDTYAEWCDAHRDAVRDLQQAGVRCHAVPVSIDEAAQWCADARRPFDAQGRAGFVAMKLEQSLR